jgi:tight adherence protein B
VHIWPDVVDDMGSAVKAGMSLGQTLEEISLKGPEQVRTMFAAAHRSYLASGDLAQALTHIRRDAQDPVAEKFCGALLIAHHVGGSDLGSVLRTLSDVLRDDLRVRGELLARQAWTVNGARLAVAAPWVTVLLLSVRKDAADVYSSVLGIRVLSINAVISIAAYFTMLRVGRLPVEKVNAA